jgi:hypothetical protein
MNLTQAQHAVKTAQAAADEARAERDSPAGASAPAPTREEPPMNITQAQHA